MIRMKTDAAFKNTVYLSHAIRAAIDAGQAILEVYQTDFAVEEKSDHSPLTIADRRSHNIIVNALLPLNIPILSEEGKAIPFAARKAWQRLWIVDPLDGTKEFIKRNDEFTVNIALVEKGHPVLGVIYIPVKDCLYYAEKALGAYKVNGAGQGVGKVPTDALEATNWIRELSQKAIRLPEKKPDKAPFTIVGSRSHATPDLEAYVAKKKAELGDIQFISAGSSLKICLVAEGKADLYPRLGPTMEWDTAAGQAIAEISGARMLRHDNGNPLEYNKQDLLNPWFVVQRE
jgi:3'(2'), 5'-bisphosphate nucleotidase